MLGKGREMLYKYEIACQQAGLSEEKTAEIRRMFNVIIPGLRPTLVAVQPSQIALQLI